MKGYPSHFAGFKLVECQMVEHKTKKSLKERLFSRPWQPLLQYSYSYEPLIPEGEFLVDKKNSVIYASAATLLKLQLSTTT